MIIYYHQPELTSYCAFSLPSSTSSPENRKLDMKKRQILKALIILILDTSENKDDSGT